MDITYLKSLGEKTNRIIEIHELLVSLDKLAQHSLESEHSNLTVDLTHFCNNKSGKQEDLTDALMQDMESYLPIQRVWGLQARSFPKQDAVKPPYLSIKFQKRYQFLVFDAIKEALKEEMILLNEELKARTGTL